MIFNDQQLEKLTQICETEYHRPFNKIEAIEIANNLFGLHDVISNIVRENPELEDQVNQNECDFSDTFCPIQNKIQ